MRKTKHLLATALLVPALIATAGLITTPANAVEIGTETHGSTPVTPKPATPEVPLSGTATTLGAITASDVSGNQATLTAQRGKVRITFLDGETFRIEATRTNFTDPANTPGGQSSETANIVVGLDEFPGVAASITDGATIVVKAAGGVSVEVDKATGTMTAKRADGSTIWAEASPLEFRENNTAQRLEVGDTEQFLGGGMQNGRSIHTDSVINVARNFDWDDDGYPTLCRTT